MRLNEIAAEIHRRMCEYERFGYSWEERYGAFAETWNIGGRDYTIRVGDYECGTSVKTAWALALQGTPYEGMLEGYVYSGNCKDTFMGTGLFEWVPVSQAALGDVYLNIVNHVAMCQGGGQLSEFSWGDNGAYGNRRGDQSGSESSVHGYYSYPWDGCLHYNGKGERRAEQVPGKATNNRGLKYKAHVQDIGWCDEVQDGQIAGTTGFSKRLEALTVHPDMDGLTLRISAHQQNRGWVTYQDAKKGAPVTIGTTGQSLRLEALCIEAVEIPKGLRFEFCVHVQDIGWLAWTPSGYSTGSDGQYRRIEAICMRVVNDNA